jgi:hypothetical protein
MIKTGIYRIDQLLRGEGRTFLRGELKQISITLYDQLADLPQREEFAERILQLFADVRGAYKRTYRERFAAFDARVLELMRHPFDSTKPLVVEDVAVSDARTSVDFFTAVAAQFPQVEFRATDYDPDVFVLESGKQRVTMDRQQRVLEIVYPPFVFNLIKRDSYRHYPLNHLIRWWAQRFVARPMLARAGRGLLSARRIHLFSPQAQDLARRDARFQLDRHDLLQPFPAQGRAHVIRAMNVLNPAYFHQADLRHVLRQIHAALVEGGWLVTGSNEDAHTPIDGGIYRKQSTGFEPVWVSGLGSPIAAVAAQLQSGDGG